MIVLGKTEPLPYRPDDPTKPIDTQVCVLDEEGKFYEVMYTTTDIRTDSYKSPITPEEAVDIYGYDLVFMLYRALYEYVEKEEEPWLHSHRHEYIGHTNTLGAPASNGDSEGALPVCSMQVAGIRSTDIL